MIEKIVGIDPDSVRHGVAVYVNSELVELNMMARIEIIERFKRDEGTLFSIENALQTNHIFSDSSARNPRTQKNVALKVGRQQQAFIELVNDLEHYGFCYILQKISKQWKKGEEQVKRFKKETGWAKKSNEDTRSAAYFGYLALIKKGEQVDKSKRNTNSRTKHKNGGDRR